MPETLTCPHCFKKTPIRRDDCAHCGKMVPDYLLKSARAKLAEESPDPPKVSRETEAPRIEPAPAPAEPITYDEPVPAPIPRTEVAVVEPIEAARPVARREYRDTTMKLLLRRDQRSGILGGKVTFTLDVRVEISAHMQDLIKRYKLGGEVLYHKGRVNLEGIEQHGPMMQLTKVLAARALDLRITINDLVKGKHIECKDLNEMLEAEDQIRSMCGVFKDFLMVAANFGGEEVVEI